jgi:acetolactate synthase-1/2/3 large subunit
MCGQKKRGWKAVVEALNAQKIKHVFGLPADPQNFYDDLYDFPDIKPILVRHEASGTFMAYAYARVTGGPSVCFGSPGPGVANLVPGFLEAYSSCLPIIAPCPAATQEHEGMGAFQETDQVSIFKPISKWSIRIPRADRVPWFMRRAFSLAVNGKPGPVFLELPSDVGHERVDMPKYIPVGNRIRIRGDAHQINAATIRVLKAERPVIIAGGGVVLSGAFKELCEFSEMMGIPVLTTPAGRGSIPEDHPLACGLVGLYRTRISKNILEESDLVIGIGSRNEEFQSGAWKFFPEKAKYIQIDIDSFEIGRNWIPDVAVVGDAKLVLEDMIRSLKGKIQKKRLKEMPRITKIIQAKKEFEAEIDVECNTKTKSIKTKQVVREISKIFDKDTILVNENGMQDLWSYYWPYYKVLDIGDCVPPGEQTCMGLGVAGSIGAKIARPEKKVICMTGDGAFQMFMQELPTAIQYHAPVNWVVLNNFSLGWIKLLQKVADERFIATDFNATPDFTKIAEANKCYGRRVERPSEIRPAIEDALKMTNEGKPAVLDFIVDPWDFSEGFQDFHKTVWNIDLSST